MTNSSARVNGRPAKSVMLTGPSPLKDQNNRAQRERDWLVATQRQDGSVHYFVFIAPDQDFASDSGFGGDDSDLV